MKWKFRFDKNYSYTRFLFRIFLTKKVISCYYNRKIANNREKLSTIVAEKKKIINEVTETETYKKAKEILSKFAPDELNMSPVSKLIFIIIEMLTMMYLI